MWQRFTERARRVILLGQEEAGKMNSGHVGTEHLLLGLVRENEGVAAQVLQQRGLSAATIRRDVEAKVESAPLSGGEPKLTPQSKRVLELAAREALQMRHKYIGTEHMLLGLLREKNGLAARVLAQGGLSLQETRDAVIAYLNTHAQEDQRAVPVTQPPASLLERLTEQARKRFLGG